MHHSLALYGRYQRHFLAGYIRLAKLTRIPVAGGLVRWAANKYANRGHSGYYLTLPDAEKIIDLAESVAMGPCSCRKIYHNCDSPINSEIILGDGTSEIFASRKNEIRAISREDAKAKLREAHDNLLTTSIMHCGEHFYAICSCCRCCCVPTRLKNEFGIGEALVRNPNIVKDFQEKRLS